MRIYSNSFSLTIELEYKDKISDGGISVFSKSGQEIPFTQHTTHHDLIISLFFGGPETVYLRLDNVNGNTATIKSISVDNIPINHDKLTTVCKYYSNPMSVDADAASINNLVAKPTTNLRSNCIIVFDMFAKDVISYLLFIGNEIEF